MRPYPESLSVAELVHKGFWIFDLDGTLTLPTHDFAAMRRELGVPVGAGILEHLQQQPETLRAKLNSRLIEIEIEVAERAEPMPEAQALIHALVERGAQLAIVTRNRRDCVDIVLQRLDLQHCFLPAQIIASECAEPKPSPAGIERLISNWQCDQDACVMLGDYLYDLQAGRAAGISTVHLNPHAGPRWPEQTDLELSSFAPLLRALIDSRMA